MLYKFDPNESFWLTNLEDCYQNFYKDIENYAFTLAKDKEISKAKAEYNKANINYEQKHSETKLGFARFCLYFTWIAFIIPWIFNLIWYLNLLKNKRELLEKIEEARAKYLWCKQDFVDEFDINEYLDSVFDLLDYQEGGPINQKLIDDVLHHDLVNLDFSSDFNPYKTSWGIWNNNKIVFDLCVQEHVKMQRVYTLTSDDYQLNNGTLYSTNSSTPSTIATFTHEFCDVYNHPSKYYAYIKSCSNLKLKYLDKKKDNKSIQGRLENEEFNKAFNFEYNDPVQYRMIFTPHKQEIMVNEFKSNGNVVEPEDQLNKIGSFLFTNYEDLGLLDVIKENINNELENFATDSEIGLGYFLFKLEQNVADYFKIAFKSLKHLFTSPIMYSENHKTIIDKVKNNSEYLDKYLPHYILNNVIQEEIIHHDSPCFNEVIKNEAIPYEHFTLYHCVMDGLSYIHEIHTADVNPNSGVVGTYNTVPIEYIETIPDHKEMEFFYTFIHRTKQRKRYIDADTLINQLSEKAAMKFDDLIADMEQNNLDVYLKENFIAIKAKDGWVANENIASYYIEKIIKILTN